MDLQKLIKNKLDKRKYLYLFLDIEGTLLPGGDTQTQPRPRYQIIKALESLQNIKKISVNLLSEYSVEQAENLIANNDFNYIGYWGGEIKKNSHIEFLFGKEEYEKIFNDIIGNFYAVFKNMVGVKLQQTPFYITVSYAQNHSPAFYHSFNLWLKNIYPKIIRYRLMPVFCHNHKFILKPAKLRKFAAVNNILEEKDLHKSVIIYVGNSFMDEEIFHMLKDKGITVRIDNYPAATNAHYRFRSDIELIQFLNMISDFYL